MNSKAIWFLRILGADGIFKTLSRRTFQSETSLKGKDYTACNSKMYVTLMLKLSSAVNLSVSHLLRLVPSLKILKNSISISKEFLEYFSYDVRSSL